MIDIGRKKPGSSRLFAATPQRQKRENAGLPRSHASVVWRTSAASTRFPKFVTRPRIFANELRKAKGTSKPMMLISLFEHDLRANASRLSRGKTGTHFS